MFLQRLELNIAEQPCLLPGEAIIFVQDAVGLYEGKNKVPNLQNGRAYLTTHRVCYVDNHEPRANAIAIDLKSVERHEFYPRWLKSSPKITLHPKVASQPSTQDRNQSDAQYPLRSSNASSIYRAGSPFADPGLGSISHGASNATWVCTICSFANPVPSNFDPATANSNMILPPCLSCGIKPTYPHVLKAVLKATVAKVPGKPNNQFDYQVLAQPLPEIHNEGSDDSHIRYSKTVLDQTSALAQTSRFQCPRCTFQNHPWLSTCEICGFPLRSSEDEVRDTHREYFERPDSPGLTLNGANRGSTSDTECVKLSFRAGGEKDFYARLKGAMVQRKWLLQNAPPVPDSYPDQSFNHGTGVTNPLQGRAWPPGIAGLEQQGLDRRRKNEAVIGSAFEDLDALMASAKEIIAIAESFANNSDDKSADTNQIIADSAKALSMVTTKDMLSSSTDSESLYLSELSRNLTEYLTDNSKGVLHKEGGIMSLVDLWAVFNQARGGVELISPLDLEKAAHLWEKLKLPVRLRRFRDGLLVVQQADRTDDKTIAQLLTWLQELHSPCPDNPVPWDVEAFGRGITAQQAAQHFGWSVGVANEELEMAEEKGVLCREEGVEGLRFWENWIENDEDTGGEDNDGINVDPLYDIDPIKQNLEDMGLF